MSPRLHIHAFNHTVSSFHFFGVLGFLSGTLLGVYIGKMLHLQENIILLLALVGAATFFTLTMLSKVISGKEAIVYYHHEIAILIVCSVVLGLMKLPVLPYLDITLLGIATFLAFGRIGCFSVGCCHGRPAKKGVVYGHEHVKAGFTFYYEGIPLFPIQLIESIFVFLMIIVGSFFLLSHLPSGTFLILYTVGYGSFRFIIEFFRGDPERPYFKGLSEAQWTTLLLVIVSLAFGIAGYVPLYTWHLIISVFLFLLSIIIVLRENVTNRIGNKIDRPAHINQVAMAINRSAGNTEIKVDEKIPGTLINIYQTDLGICLSRGQLIEQGIWMEHYTISCQGGLLTRTIVKKLAKVIQEIRRHKSLYKILEQDNKVFHILFKE